MPEEKADIANIYASQENSEKKSQKPVKVSSKKKMSKNRLKAKLLNVYYKNPTHEMKLVCVTGMTGKTAVARFLHQILTDAGERSAVLISDGEVKTSVLHKFLHDAWENNTNYAIVTAPADSIEDDLFAELEIFAAVLTDYIPSRIGDPTAEEYEAADDTLFDKKPAYVILNRDDTHYETFAKSLKGEIGTITYGEDLGSDMLIASSRLYRRGTEASLDYEGKRFTVASFFSGKPAISYMACTAATAAALGISTDSIINGLADCTPEEG